MRWLACLLVLVAVARAEPTPGVRVIVNAKNPATRLERRFVADAFLKKRTRWDDDAQIQPVDLGQRSSERAEFSREVLDRDVSSVRRYWAQQVFSGRGVPPPEVSNDADVVHYVAEHPGGIGYVSAAAGLSGVKAVEVE
jgi:ABC-type phosphate transport system substrate-binding protein